MRQTKFEEDNILFFFFFVEYKPWHNDTCQADDSNEMSRLIFYEN